LGKRTFSPYKAQTFTWCFGVHALAIATKAHILKDPQLQERGEELVVELAAIDRLSLTGMIKSDQVQEDQLYFSNSLNWRTNCCSR